MRTNRKAAYVLAAAVASIAGFAPTAHADFSWVPAGATGGGNWNVTANWLEDGSPASDFPDAVGAVVNITNDISAGATINMPNPPVTLGVLNIGDSGTVSNLYTVQSNSILLDNGANPAQINKTGIGANANARDRISSNLTIPANGLTVTATATDASIAQAIVELRGRITGGKITKEGNGAMSFTNASGVDSAFDGLLIKAGAVRLEGSANRVAVSGLIEIRYNTTLRNSGGINNPLSPTCEIYIPKDAIAPNTDVGGTFGMGAGGFFNTGFAAGSNTDSSIDGSTFTNSNGTQTAIGSLESDAYGTQIGGTNRGIVTIGGNNLDRTFEGRLIGRSSFVKVGTGVMTLAGVYNNAQTATTSTNVVGQVGETVNVFRHFKVLGGRVDLNKGNGTIPGDAISNPAAIAQTFVYIGDGVESGATRPEVRLLRSDQIEVQSFDLTDGSAVTRSETNQMRLNSGVFNLNGFTEEIQSIQVTQTGGFDRSTVALGDNGQLYLNGGLTVDSGAVGEITSTNNSRPAIKIAGATPLTLNGVLDLQDNKLAVVGGSVSTLNSYVASGRNGGGWNGSAGIITSKTNANAATLLTTIGVADAGYALDITGADTATFGGQTVSPTDVLAAYTYAGDSDLNETIDGDDFAAIDAGYESNGSLTGYQNGDFDYSGTINADDYWLINANYSRQFTNPLPAPIAEGVTAVPEPASLSLLALGTVNLLRRKRRS